MKRVDLTTLYAICGDPSSHILEALSTTPVGERIEVLYRRGDEAVEESLKLLEESGIGRIESRSCNDVKCRAIIVRTG